MTIRWPWSRSADASPSTTFHDLVDACRDEGCPVCRLGRDASLDSLEAILYESVNDPGVRGALRRSWGFCPAHAPLLRQVEHAAGGVAIMYRDFLDRARERLCRAADEAERRGAAAGGARLWRRRPAPAGALATRQGPCPACQAQRGAEARALAALLAHLDDPRLREAYAASAGLCLPHLEAAWREHAGHARLPALLREAGQRAGRLAGELAEFVRKLDYRFGHEPVGDEGTAWLRALDWFSGARLPPEPQGARLRRRRRRGPGAAGEPGR